jgi:DMSO/TMAO reductase YedYZ molybdopterin-dependent catalytic subunit
MGLQDQVTRHERIMIYPINGEDLVKEHGGPLQVHIVDYEHIKFRRKRDAVIFSLRNF